MSTGRCEKQDWSRLHQCQWWGTIALEEVEDGRTESTSTPIFPSEQQQSPAKLGNRAPKSLGYSFPESQVMTSCARKNAKLRKTSTWGPEWLQKMGDLVMRSEAPMSVKKKGRRCRPGCPHTQLTGVNQLSHWKPAANTLSIQI